MISLSPKEIDVILTSLNYSKQRISEGRDATIEIKKESLSKIESIEVKLRLFNQ